MRRKTIQYIGLVFACFALSACKIKVDSDLYTADIYSHESHKFPAKMLIEVPSCSSERLAEISKDILSIFSDLSNAEITGCSRIAMESFLAVNFEGMLTSEDSLYDLTIWKNAEDPNSEWIFARVFPHPEFISRANQLSRANHAQLDSENIRISVSLHNDLREDVRVVIRESKVNGENTMFSVIELAPRQKLDIEKSNIFSGAVLDMSAPTLFGIARREHD